MVRVMEIARDLLSLKMMTNKNTKIISLNATATLALIATFALATTLVLIATFALATTFALSATLALAITLALVVTFAKITNLVAKSARFTGLYSFNLRLKLSLNIRFIYISLLVLYTSLNVIFSYVQCNQIESISFLNDYLIFMEGSQDNPNSSGDAPEASGSGQSGSDAGGSNMGGEGSNNEPNNGFDFDMSTCNCCVDGVCQDSESNCQDHKEDDPNEPLEEDTSRNCCNCGTDHFTYSCDTCDCVQCKFCYEESNNDHPGGPNTEHEGEPDSEVESDFDFETESEGGPEFESESEIGESESENED